MPRFSSISAINLQTVSELQEFLVTPVPAAFPNHSTKLLIKAEADCIWNLHGSLFISKFFFGIHIILSNVPYKMIQCGFCLFVCFFFTGLPVRHMEVPG